MELEVDTFADQRLDTFEGIETLQVILKPHASIEEDEKVPEQIVAVPADVKRLGLSELVNQLLDNGGYTRTRFVLNLL
jgi:hypothetical protein